MAVKGKAEITLTFVKDIQAYYRYYLLQSSTAATPSKPTAYPPPSTWDDTEPTYTSGSTNSLYFVDCTVFCDGTFSYSDVSLSTAYEAAKEAYNKAGNAKTAADDAAKTATNYIQGTTDGFIVGNVAGSTLGNNVLIDSVSLKIRNGSSVLATFGADLIELGKNSADSVIELCGGVGRIKADATEDPEAPSNKTLVIDSGVITNKARVIDLTTSTVYDNLETYNQSSMTDITSWSDQGSAYIDLIARDIANSLDARAYLNANEQAGSLIEIGVTGYDSGVGVRFFAPSKNSSSTYFNGIEVESNDLLKLTNQNTGNSIGIGLNSGGVNRGMYDYVKSKWQIYSDATDLYLGPPGYSVYKPYLSKGDSISIQIRTAGFVTNSGKTVYFEIPLSRPIIGSPTITAASVNGCTLRSIGGYSHGSSASAYAKPSSYSVSYDTYHIGIAATFSSTTNATNNTPIGIDWSGKLTFS